MSISSITKPYMRLKKSISPLIGTLVNRSGMSNNVLIVKLGINNCSKTAAAACVSLLPPAHPRQSESCDIQSLTTLVQVEKKLPINLITPGKKFKFDPFFAA